MKLYYSDHFPLELPPGHRFPAAKYALLHQALLEQRVFNQDELIPAEPARWEEIALAHSLTYIQQVRDGTLSLQAQRQIGLPWSPELVQRSLASVGGSLAAARQALASGISGNLAGGTHHATADEGMGYCVFNDLAVVIQVLKREQPHLRIAVVDLDVHQGNGTAAILGHSPGVFLLSLHGEKNYPFRKVSSTLDIGLPDNTDDTAYLQALEHGLQAVFDFQPDLLLYQAGVDVLAEDTLGRLALTLEGVAARDRRVIHQSRKRGIPLAIVMGGGYARPIERTVQAHVQTYRIAKEMETVLPILT